MAEKDRVRDLLERELRALDEEAANRNGEISPERLDTLNRLVRLVEIREKMSPVHPARWRVAALLAGTLAVVSLLLFLRVRETQVELDLVVSEAGFVLAHPQVLTDYLRLAELRASGLTNVQFSAGAGPTGVIQQASTALRVATSSRGDTSGSVTLAPLNLPGRIAVRVEKTSPRADCSIVLSGIAAPVRATLNGRVQVETPDAALRELRLESPRPLVLETDSGGTSLQLALAPGTAAAFSPQLAVERLAFSRIDEFQGLDGTTAEEVSTILSGDVYLEELNGTRRPVRAAELLRFDEITGVLRTLQIADGHLTLHFNGRVRGMRSGWGSNPTSLMPTWLEWLQARHGLSLLWGTSLYLFGFAAAALRWWRIKL